LPQCEVSPPKPYLMHDQNLTFDYIIIGAGTAGCLLANRLSADASKRVLLIEAGRKDDYHWIHIPVGYLYCIGNPRTDWLFNTEPDAGLNGRSLRYPRGKTLGGCSSINGMIYMRGQARDYDKWAELTGDSAWTWDNALPCFKLHEDHYKGADALHGARGVAPALMEDKHQPYQKILRHRNAGGEWRVEKQRLRWDILDAFAEAASQAGIPQTPDFNRGSNEGVGYFEVNQKNGWRWNTSKAFLRPTCLGRPNFELWTNAQVSKLVIEPQADGSQRCTGVEVWTGQERVTALAASARRTSCSFPALVRPGCSNSTASRWCRTCRASAPTCRTTCRSARCTRSGATRTARAGACRSTPWPIRCGEKRASAWNTRCAAPGR
jgi:choline dehydrogenase